MLTPCRGLLCHWVEDRSVEVKFTEGNLPSFLAHAISECFIQDWNLPIHMPCLTFKRNEGHDYFCHAFQPTYYHFEIKCIFSCGGVMSVTASHVQCMIRLGRLGAQCLRRESPRYYHDLQKAVSWGGTCGQAEGLCFIPKASRLTLFRGKATSGIISKDF